MSASATAVAAGVLGRHVGLRLDDARVAHALQRLAEQRAVSPDALAAGLDADAAALDSLIDDLTVQESSFFRHPAQFEVLARHVLPGLEEPITVWSAGCANGQEAYSVAMVLDELGCRDWQVIATDVNRAAVERTERGSYDARELRGLDAARLLRHGHPTAAGWQINSALLERVVTLRHRVAHDPRPVPAGSCQVVLCRNVLIYLDAGDARRVLARARDALADGGWLLLGGAEALVHRVDGLETNEVAGVFAYRRPAVDVSLKRERAKSVR